MVNQFVFPRKRPSHISKCCLLILTKMLSYFEVLDVWLPPSKSLMSVSRSKFSIIIIYRCINSSIDVPRRPSLILNRTSQEKPLLFITSAVSRLLNGALLVPPLNPDTMQPPRSTTTPGRQPPSENPLLFPNNLRYLTNVIRNDKRRYANSQREAVSDY